MEVKRIIDLSQPITGTCINPAFPCTTFTEALSYDRDGWFGEVVTAAIHVGTHIDSPSHRFRNGKTIDQYFLIRFQGNAIPINLYHKKAGEEITDNDILPYMSKIKEGDIVLLCTGWSEKKKEKDNDEYIYQSPWLGKKACEMLIAAGVNAVGIDHFSIGGANPNNVTIPHDLLLLANVLIFEDMLLPKELFEKESWYVAAFPVNMGKTTGSFARIVAIDFA